jgi:hypothetical protein
VGISTIKKFTSGRGWGMTPGRVTRQIKCLIAQAPGGHTPPHTWSELFNGWNPHPLTIYIYDQGE